MNNKISQPVLEQKVRLGSIKFFNSLPLDYGLKRTIEYNQIQKKGRACCTCLKGSYLQDYLNIELVEDIPARLNKMLLSGELDISPISSIEYAKAQDKLLILPNLSISSDSGVNSVILVSKTPVEELEGNTIYLTDKGATTPVLLRILLEYHYKIRVNIEKNITNAFQFYLDKKMEGAVLLIGDEALRVANQDDGFFKTDLSLVWHQFSGQKMIFALWVAREDFAHQYPEMLRDIHNALLASKEWGKKHIEYIANYASSISSLEPEIFEEYFQSLRYDFDENYQQGLQIYYEYAQKIGELKEKVIFREY